MKDFRNFWLQMMKYRFVMTLEICIKITKKQTKRTISLNDVNSAMTTRISKNKLHQIINELFYEIV